MALTYTWDSAAPADTAKVYHATEATQNVAYYIREAKSSIAERLQCLNGTVAEHKFYGSTATGKHPLSYVGFVKIWATAALMDTGVAADAQYKQDGTLHYVTATSRLYTFKDGVAVLIASKQHDDLTGTGDDDHTQYADKDGDVTMTGNLAFSATATLVINDHNAGVTEPLLNTHLAESWYTGHGAGNVRAAHFKAGSIKRGNVPGGNLSCSEWTSQMIADAQYAIHALTMQA